MDTQAIAAQRNEGVIEKLREPLLWLIPMLLCGVGIVMIASSSSGAAIDVYGSPYALGAKQFVWLLIALGAMVCGYAIPVGFWYRTSGLLWILALMLALLTLFTPLGATVGGARRWLRLGPLPIQTSELLAFTLVIHVAKKITGEEQERSEAFRRCMGVVLLTLPLVLLQPDMGGTLLLLALAMGLFVEAWGWFYPLCTGVLSLLAVAPLILFKGYRMRRILALVDPWSDPLNTGFQVIQGLIAFANGNLWGLGVGHGLQKLQYLPAAHTDFIFAAIGEELGLLGTLFVLFLFFLWIWRAWSVYILLPWGFERSLLWGMVLSIVLPLLINVGGVTKVIPLTGIPLPFVSYGGSALVMAWMRTGIILRLARESRS